MTGRQIRAIALDYGGTIDQPGSPLLDGSRQVDPACIPVLRYLAGSGYMLVLSSNTRPGQHRTAALAAAGVSRLFRLVLMSACLGVRKPDPGFYALITAFARCQPDEVLHVGDNLANDVLGPARCGMRTALICPGGITGDEQSQLPAGALVISHLTGLPRLLGPEAATRCS